MKKLFFFLMIATFSGSAMAQQTATSAQRVEKNKAVTNDQRAESFSGKWTKELGCTGDQRAQIKAAKLVQLDKIQALDAKYPGEDRKNHQAEYKVVQDEFMKSMQGILTPEQFKKFQDEKAAKKIKNADVK